MTMKINFKQIMGGGIPRNEKEEEEIVHKVGSSGLFTNRTESPSSQELFELRNKYTLSLVPSQEAGEILDGMQKV
jgi:hypothetical protein